ncbi:MAG: NADPH-dependent 7-cyano-7-deazaguanine reductase QueF [Candidatus Omnitrophica bacterium]|nr:NADPH-dependent 7-cyano-7-deazaguanine reductase QueF [Candidatus Omnitrophota bacterium]
MVYEDRIESALEKKAKKVQGKTFRSADIDATLLETIPYEYPQRKITVELVSREFTCICPFSGLPDFATVSIRYTPRRKLIELKALKYYLYAYRNVKVYNEHVVNKILADLKKILQPWQITVIGEFTSRGGITNRVEASG